MCLRQVHLCELFSVTPTLYGFNHVKDSSHGSEAGDRNSGALKVLHISKIALPEKLLRKAEAALKQIRNKNGEV
jgi:hypothetical protein